MRNLILPAALLVTVLATAQTDINKMIQERMAGSGMKIEDDTSPFVPNEFIGSFRMEMHMLDGATEKKNSPTNMHYWSTEDMTMNKMEMSDTKGQDMRMMTDLKNKWQYTLMIDERGKKSAMKSKKKKVTMAETEKKAGNEPEITVTNETKTIEGHVCTKAIVKTEEGLWTGWVAKDLKAPFSDMNRNTGQRGNEQMMKNMKGLQGFPLEFEWVDAKGNGRMVCNIKDLKVGSVDPSVFSLDGFEVMEMPSFGQ
ncbi:MAG: DUF4412 domain-containing protein [Flavobacteriales bacterium]|nr:DUF4412 domain-containing protein [Flavobacteriales bacterium]